MRDALLRVGGQRQARDRLDACRARRCRGAPARRRSARRRTPLAGSAVTCAAKPARAQRLRERSAGVERRGARGDLQRPDRSAVDAEAASPPPRAGRPSPSPIDSSAGAGGSAITIAASLGGAERDVALQPDLVRERELLAHDPQRRQRRRRRSPAGRPDTARSTTARSAARRAARGPSSSPGPAHAQRLPHFAERAAIRRSAPGRAGRRAAPGLRRRARSRSTSSPTRRTKRERNGSPACGRDRVTSSVPCTSRPSRLTRFEPRRQALALRRRVEDLHAHVVRVVAVHVVVGVARQRAIVGHAVRDAERVFARRSAARLSRVEQRQLHRVQRDALRRAALRDEQRHRVAAVARRAWLAAGAAPAARRRRS